MKEPIMVHDALAPLFVTGTDTGIGKTVLSLLLMQYYVNHGARPFYFKPFQTGCRYPLDRDSDAAFVYGHIPRLVHQDPAQSMLFCYPAPKAPYFAARQGASAIDLPGIAAKIDEKSRDCHPIIVEGAGGLMVPILKDYLMIHLIRDLGARPILAARAGLGTINHTLLSIDQLRQFGLKPAAVVFLDSTYPETPPEMIAENRQAVESVSGFPVCGCIGRIEDFRHPPAAAQRVVARVVDGLIEE
jgi:dethiobiotin synthetase